MSDILNYLQSRADEAKQKLQQVNEKIQALQSEKETLIGDLQGYERIVSAEMRERGVSGPLPAPVTESVGQTGSDVNKAEFARKFIRERASSGVTPADIFRGFSDAGIQITRPYVYSLVQRLSKRNLIRQRRGKWFPILESEASMNGTVN